MSTISEILDRLSGIAVVREKLAQQDKIIEGMQRIMLEQQKEIAELRGLVAGLRMAVPGLKKLR